MVLGREGGGVLWGSGEASGSKALALQAERPEFKTQNTRKKQGMVPVSYMPVLGRDDRIPGLIGQPPRLIGESKTIGDTVSN